MSAKSELAIKASVAAYLRKKAADLLTDTKHDLSEWMDEGDRTYAIVDGEKIGTVSVSAPEPGPKVTDPDALLDWCRKNQPDAIVETVAPWFTASANLKAMLEKTGELPDGVDIVRGEPSVSVRVSAAQGEVLADLLSRGQVAGLIEEA